MSTRPRRPGRWVAVGVVTVMAAGAAVAWRTGVFSPAASSGTGQQGAPPPATSAVVREDLAATTPVSATLGYAGTYPVSGHGGGTLTWLPSPGQVITQGQVLDRTDNANPVVLLYGSVPDWRDLAEAVGTVATTTQGQNGSSTTIPVQVKLTDPQAAGTLDQAPVTVYVTTQSARNVLTVPVTALLAQSSGGYDVEVVGHGNARSYVPVTAGLFDDNSGMVQVTGALTPGERVVVAAS